MHSADSLPVKASNGLQIMADGDLDAIPEHAPVLICGGLDVQHHMDQVG